MAETEKEQPPAAEAGLRFTIDAVGGVDHAELVLVPGRLNVLIGRNGAGKTSAARAVLRVLGDESQKLEVRDGEDLGTIHGPDGAKAVIPMAGKMRVDSGDLMLSAASMSAFTDLITGAYRKGDDERANARIRAFLQIVQPVVDEAAIKLLCERDPEMVAWLTEQVAQGRARDLLGVGNVLKAELQRRAREHEAAAERWGGQFETYKSDLAAAERLLAGADPDEMPVELYDGAIGTVEQQHRAAIAAHTRVSDAAGARLEREEHVARIREAATPRPDVAAAEQVVVAAHDEWTAAGDRHDTITARREELLRMLAEVERDRAAAAEAMHAARRRKEEAEAAAAGVRRAAEQWDEQQRTLDEPIFGPTQAEVDAAAAAITEVEGRLAHLRNSRAVVVARTNAEQAAVRQKQEADRGHQLREWGLAISDRLADVLRKQGVEGFTVVDGRLAVQVNGETRDFEARMSDGERLAAALPLVGSRFNGLVYLEPEFFSRLDEEHRRDLDKLAAAHPDLILVTEVPTSGNLSVQHGVE